ncbi:MAG: Tim44-like domain-containing protein [Oscillospiraceae bacterium]|nr:Tim44-like domain-containing protein [Oscillospiraceae bacterium]
MKKISYILLTILLVFAVFAAFSVFSGAFDSNDYGSDWGSSDWGSSDSGSSYDRDDSGGAGYYSSGGGGGGGDDGEFSAITILIIFVVVIAAAIVSGFKNKKSGGAGSGGGVRPASYQGLNVTLPDRTGQIEGIIKQKDPNFSANDFLSFAKEVYIDIQTAWCKRDMSPVQPVLHDNLFNSTQKQLQAKIEQGVIYHYESIVVNTAYLTSYASDAQFEYATIYLNARMIDWQEDEKTGKILRGDKNTRWDLRYKMKFMRSTGVVTKEEVAGAKGHNCPNCGAPLEISSSGKCAYCNSVVTTGQYSWVLSDFGTVRDDTKDEGIRN